MDLGKIRVGGGLTELGPGGKIEIGGLNIGAGIDRERKPWFGLNINKTF